MMLLISSLFSTILAAIVLMLLVVVGLGIGLLLTGKTRLKRGCGMTPGKGKEKNSDSSCPLCGNQEKCHEKENHDTRKPSD